MNHEFIPSCAKYSGDTKVHEAQAIVIFGDISGFTNWTRRNPHHNQSIKKLLDDFSQLVVGLCKQRGYWAKLMGDGVMLIKEVGHMDPKDVGSILKEIQQFCLNVRYLIASLPYPRPQGFRCRIVAGPVIKWHVKGERCESSFTEYVGYVCNLCSRLLYVYRDESCIAHESVKELMKDNDAIEFKHLPKPEHTPSGIDVEDTLELYTFAERER